MLRKEKRDSRVQAYLPNLPSRKENGVYILVEVSIWIPINFVRFDKKKL